MSQGRGRGSRLTARLICSPPAHVNSVHFDWGICAGLKSEVCAE